MSCPYEAVLTSAVTKCPFLHNLAERQGHAYASSIAVNPLVSASCAKRRPVLEEEHLEQHLATFRLFHGPSGVVPLVKQQQYVDKTEAMVSKPSSEVSTAPRQCLRSPLAGAPLATMSLSAFGGGLPDFGKLLRAMQEHTQQPRKHQPNSRQKAGPAPNGSSSAAGSGAAGDTGAGSCPMRKVLGPLAPIVFNPKGHLQCPEVIVKARAALAATKPVRQLRPQQLPVKILAIGATCAAVNMPFGMWREHCEKFSGAWFVAVHASIPFIAMLRKAVIMPKWAILFTIATAIAGQAMGAKMERRRLAAARPTKLTTSPPVSVPAATAPASFSPASLTLSSSGLSQAAFQIGRSRQQSMVRASSRAGASSRGAAAHGALSCAISSTSVIAPSSTLALMPAEVVGAVPVR